MATEQEELRLVVTLVDNASAGLGKLQDQIKELGGEHGSGIKHVEKLNEGVKALTETVLKMTGGFGEAFKSLGMLHLGFLGGVAGVAAFGYEMAKQIKDLSEYTDKLRNIGQLGKTIGIDRAQIKSVADQLAVYAVSLDQATASISKFAQRQAELQRDPRLRMGILQQTDPRHLKEMKELIDSFGRAETLQDKLNIAERAYKTFYDNARKVQHQSEEEARDTARKGMEMFGYDTVLSYAGKLKNLTDEQKKAADEANAAADHYSETLGKIKGTWEDISDIQHKMWVRMATPPAEWLERLLNYFKEGAEKGEAAGGPRAFYQQLLKERENRQPHDFEGRWPGANEQFKYLPGPGGVQKQSYRAIGVEGNPLLHQAAFVAEDHKKVLDENTEQLKQLNDLLRTAMGLGGGTGAGAGGFQNAAFTTGDGFSGGGGIGGRGTTPRFGSKEYPNLGNDGAAGGGGGGSGGSGDSAAGGPRMTQSKREVAQTVAKSLKAGGMSDDMIAGVMANINDESRFDPNVRVADQPHFGGEAHFAHGLYQEGGTEWNNYAAWLKQNHPGENWRDPKLQSDFLAQNLQKNYPGTWKRMMAAKSPGEAAAIFVKEYLKPRADLLAGRAAKYRRGVPGVDAYTKSQAKEEPATAQTLLPSPQTAGEQPKFGGVSQDPHPEAPSSEWGGGLPFTKKGDVHDFLDPSPMAGRSGMMKPNVLTEKGVRDAIIRRSLDQAQNGVNKVEGTGKITVDVNAPKGTNVSAEGGGLFKDVETNRQTQMEPAEMGPGPYP